MSRAVPLEESATLDQHNATRLARVEKRSNNARTHLLQMKHGHIYIANDIMRLVGPARAVALAALVREAAWADQRENMPGHLGDAIRVCDLIARELAQG